jgi:hypothetical protein
MESLYLFSNSLTGTIPVELSTMTSMIYLALSSNSLTGTIPVELSVMTSITVLSLESNSLTGTIPVQLSTMTGSVGWLTPELSLYSNSLTGVVPSYLCDAAPSTCDLVDSGSNAFWCSSVCDTGSGPCDLTTSNCYSGPSPSTVPTTPAPTRFECADTLELEERSGEQMERALGEFLKCNF